MTTKSEPLASLIRIPSGGGEDFKVAGAKLTWKVKSDATEERFCFFEQVLEPGDGVPMHVHNFTETFYILAGTVTFFEAAGSAPLKSGIGDVVVARPGAFHGFVNEGDKEARLLSISVPEHQRFFDAVARADRETPFSSMSPDIAMQHVAAIGAETDAVFSPPPAA